MFNSSILKEQSAKATNKFVLEDSVNEQKESFIYDLLEFNNTMHKIDVEEKINYYRALAEYSIDSSNELVLQENIIESIRNFLTTAIEAIKTLLGKFLKFIKGKTGNDILTQMKSLKSEFDSIKNDIRPGSSLDKTRDLNVYIRPNIHNISNTINGLIGNIPNLLDNVFNNSAPSKDVIEFNVELIYKGLKKTGAIKGKEYTKPVTNSKEFRDYVTTYAISTEKRRMRVADYLDSGNYFDSANTDIRVAEKEIGGFISTLNKMEKDVNTRVGAMNPEDKDVAIFIITSCKNILNDIIWYFNAIIDTNIKAAAEWINVYKSTKGIHANESGMIHGEEFNSDTLFDNEDINDFNRTEWLDLELTTESYEFLSAILEYRRRVAVNEAMIISENGVGSFRKVVAMQEAEIKKLGDKFMEIVNAIVSAVDKFFANLQDRLSSDVNYIKENEEIIKKPIKLINMSSTGDILKGMERVQVRTTPDRYNYESMKNCNNEKDFFDNYIKPKLSNLNGIRNGIDIAKMSVSEICKAWFGASMPKETVPPITLEAKDMNIGNIISFLEAPNALKSNIRADITSLKSQAKSMASSSASNNTNPNENKPESLGDANSNPSENKPESGNTTNTTTQESMYYSELYHRWFTEAEFENPNANTNNAGGNNNTDDAKNAKSDSDAKFKIYLDANRSVLLAKLTAAEFIRSELMALMEGHIVSYDPSKKRKKSTPNNEQQPTKENNNANS